MKHIYQLFISLCIVLIVWSCDKSEEMIQDPSFSINNNELSFTGYRSSLSVKVDATRRWSAVASDYWISVTPDSYPGANESFVANVAVTVSDNATGQTREGTVTFFLQDEEVSTLVIKQSIQNEDEKPEEEFPITWANLQWKAADIINEGETFEAGSCVFADGLTNVIRTGTGGDITCDIGYSSTDTSPDGEGWSWSPCSFNQFWGESNYYYQGRTLEISVTGTYYYTFRFRNADGPYKYAGTDGLWDGETNVNGTFEVKAASSGGDDDDGIDYSKLAINWANLQWADKNGVIKKGETLNVGSKVLINGLTDLEKAATSANKHLICEIGYSATNPDPSSADWTWTTCSWNADWGNEYYYQGFTPAIPDAGAYFYTFRYRIDEGTYAYVGTDGLWNGANSVCGTFQVTE